MYPAAGLCPWVGADRGPVLRWLFFLSNTGHADLIRVFFPELFAPGGVLSLYLCPLMRWAALYPVAALVHA